MSREHSFKRGLIGSNQPSGVQKISRKPEDAPHGKKPKSRPPVGVRERVPYPLFHVLPRYSGPYSVGIMDIEVPVRKPHSISHIHRRGRKLLELETVLFTVYYPSAHGSGSGRDPAGHRTWSRPTWLSRPRHRLARGYGKFANIPEFISLAWFLGTSFFTKIPAFRNARLATHWPPETNARQGGPQVKNEAGSPPPGEPEEPCFPLLMFSHGLGGTRTAYSGVCGEFASYGFVVVAVEHRDGSSPRTFVNHPLDGPASRHEIETNGEEITHHDEERGRNWDEIDYIFPKHNPLDTEPGNENGVDRELRSAQTEMRLCEIQEAYNVMVMICNGDGRQVADMNLRRAGGKGASSRGLEGVDWKSWKDRFHLKQVTVLGHSFGAATTVEVLRYRERFNWVSQGIIYDIWGAGVKSPPDDPEHRIRTPLLGINSEAFMYWPENLKTVMSLFEEAQQATPLCWLLTVRGSVHSSQSDFSLLYPRLSSIFLKMTVEPKRAIDININASLEFLKKVMPDRISAMNRGDDEGFLEVPPIDDLPDEHRPDPKWTAKRLKIPNEFVSRVTPQVRRKIKRTAASDQSVAEEIWMHFAPSAQDQIDHGIKPVPPSEDTGKEKPGGSQPGHTDDAAGQHTPRVDGDRPHPFRHAHSHRMGEKVRETMDNLSISSRGSREGVQASQSEAV